MNANWTEAYKTAHVAAEIMDRAANGKLKPDLPRWLLKTARELMRAARKIAKAESRNAGSTRGPIKKRT